MNGVQVRNLYYVKSLGSDGAGTLGNLQIVPSVAKLSGKSCVQLKYVNPDGDVIVSDFIVKDQVISCEKIEGEGTELKAAVLELISDPIAGEDYIVDVLVHNYQTLSDNSTLTKFGAVHAKTGMTTHEFMWRMAKSLCLNFRRDEAINKFFTFYIAEIADHAVDDSTITEVTFSSAMPATWDDSATYCLIVKEEEQKTWYRGTFPKQTVSFDVAPHTVIEDGDEVQPFETVGESGLVEIKKQSEVFDSGDVVIIPNGYAMADLEYLCHGEIGDQLREVNYPRNIRTKYAITDADVTKTFDAVEIVFYYVGRNTSSQKAEKQITLVVDADGTVSADSLLSAIKEALEPTLEGLDARVTELED